jgi:hypothetical protein
VLFGEVRIFWLYLAYQNAQGRSGLDEKIGSYFGRCPLLSGHLIPRFGTRDAERQGRRSARGKRAEEGSPNPCSVNSKGFSKESQKRTDKENPQKEYQQNPIRQKDNGKIPFQSYEERCTQVNP